MHHAPSSSLPAALEAQARTLLLQGLEESRQEVASELACHADELYEQLVEFGPFPDADETWLLNAVSSSIMPDRTLCHSTLAAHAKEQAFSSVTHFHIDGASEELRKAMIAQGLIYHFEAAAEEGEDLAMVALEFGAVTGYGLAKLLRLNLREFLHERWTQLGDF